MNSSIDIFLLLVLMLNQIWQLFKAFKRYKGKWFTQKFLLITTISCVVLLPLIQLFNQFDYIIEYKVRNLLIGLMSFNFLSLITLGVINHVTAKKVKTLWRLPVIGILLGYYLPFDKLLIAIVGVEFVILILLIIKKDQFKFYYRANLKSAIAFLLMFILWNLGIENSLVLFLMFFIYYYFRMIVINTATISYWIKEHGLSKDS